MALKWYPLVKSHKTRQSNTLQQCFVLVRVLNMGRKAVTSECSLDNPFGEAKRKLKLSCP